jgi:thiol-disulfide isomerase/thioredoxin
MRSLSSWTLPGICVAAVLAVMSPATPSFAEGMEGQMAIPFALPDLNGTMVDLKPVIGKKVILFDFWAITCIPCLKEIPKIQELYAKYADKGLQCYSVNTDFFKPDKIKEFSAQKLTTVTYPILIDSKREVTKSYKVFALPVTVIIDLEGKIRMYHTNFLDGDEKRFEKIITGLLPKGK